MPKNKQIRVNISTAVNAGAIRRERRDGEDIIIVPSATLPDDIIMNGIKYPAAEIAKSFGGLENAPAPFGHPTNNGQFVPALHHLGLAKGYIGAHNENVRQETGPDGRRRVLLDKVIYVNRAKESEGGRAVLDAIEKCEPIHTSTGLHGNLMEPDGDDHKNIIINMDFDHDAILLGESGAASPDQGVGIFVNDNGEKTEIDVINSTYEDDLDDTIEWTLRHLAESADKKSRLPAIHDIMSKIREALNLGITKANHQPKPQETSKMSDKEIEALTNSVSEIKTGLDGLGEAIANSVGTAVATAIAEGLKPITDAQNAAAEAQKAKDDAELSSYVETIVKANAMSEDVAKELTLNAAKELAAKCVPGKAAPINGAFPATKGDDAFAAPKGDDA